MRGQKDCVSELVCVFRSIFGAQVVWQVKTEVLVLGQHGRGTAQIRCRLHRPAPICVGPFAQRVRITSSACVIFLASDPLPFHFVVHQIVQNVVHQIVQKVLNLLLGLLWILYNLSCTVEVSGGCSSLLLKSTQITAGDLCPNPTHVGPFDSVYLVLHRSICFCVWNGHLRLRPRIATGEGRGGLNGLCPWVGGRCEKRCFCGDCDEGSFSCDSV